MTFGDWVLVVFYALSALAIAWLLRRHLERERAARAERRRRSRSESQPTVASRVQTDASADSTLAETKTALSSSQSPEEPAHKPHIAQAAPSVTADQAGELDEVRAEKSEQDAQTQRRKPNELPLETVSTQTPDKASARSAQTEERTSETAGLLGSAASSVRSSDTTADSGPRTVAGVELPPFVEDSDYVFGAVTPVLAALLPETEARKAKIRQELLRAGNFSPVAYTNLAAVRYVLVMGLLIFFGVLLILVPRSLELPVLIALVAAPAAAWALPRFYITSKAKERVRQIEHALPDFLDMLNMCVSQGLPILSALKRIGRELKPVYPALAQELDVLCHQAELTSLEEALENMRHRLDSPDIHSFATLLIQTTRMGTSVSDALTDYSDTMRETIRQRADQRANQASFKLIFPTALCLMPAVFLFLLGPAVVEMNNFFKQGGMQILQSPTEAIQQLQQTAPVVRRRIR